MTESEIGQVEPDTNPKATEKLEKLGRVTMCMSGGLFFIGRMEGAGPKLYNPRIFNLFEEQERDKQNRFLWLDEQNNPTLVNTGIPKMKEMIGMRAFPGVPPFIYLPKDVLYYPITTNIQNILALYAQVTTPPSKIVKPGGPVLVTPQGRRLN